MTLVTEEQKDQLWRESLTLVEWGSWMLVEGEGVLNQPIPSRSPRATVKKQNKFDILKVYNELGKVKTYETF